MTTRLAVRVLLACVAVNVLVALWCYLEGAHPMWWRLPMALASVGVVLAWLHAYGRYF